MECQKFNITLRLFFFFPSSRSPSNSKTLIVPPKIDSNKTNRTSVHTEMHETQRNSIDIDKTTFRNKLKPYTPFETISTVM